MTVRDELVDYGFSPTAADMLSERIHDSFDHYIIVAEEILGKGGALTRSQIIYLEYLYRSHNIGREREIWEGLKSAPERRKVSRRPSMRREVVRIYGKKVVVHRNLRNGQFCSARTRRR
jgi:hypothetical protein